MTLRKKVELVSEPKHVDWSMPMRNNNEPYLYLNNIYTEILKSLIFIRLYDLTTCSPELLVNILYTCTCTFFLLFAFLHVPA